MMEAAPPLSTNASVEEKQTTRKTRTDAEEEIDQDVEKEVMTFLSEMKPPDADDDDDGARQRDNDWDDRSLRVLSALLLRRQQPR